MTKSPVALARQALEVGRQAFPAYSHRFSPRRFTQPQLFAVLVLRQFFKTDYRGMSQMLADLSDLRKALGLKKVPHYSTLCYAEQRLIKSGAFERLLNAVFSTARGIGLLDEPVEAAIDSTGLESRHISQHFVQCTKRPSYHRRRWPKMTILCDTETHLIAGCIVTEGPSYDFGLFEPTAKQAFGHVEIDRILADAGFDSESNHQFGRDVLGIHTIIAFNNRGSSKVPTTTYRAEMKQDFDKETYNNRWQVESVFSRDKRLLGSALRGHKDSSRHSECPLRVITHNLMILHRAA